MGDQVLDYDCTMITCWLDMSIIYDGPKLLPLAASCTERTDVDVVVFTIHETSAYLLLSTSAKEARGDDCWTVGVAES